MEKPPQFIHLHTHSHHSLLDGLSKLEDLVDLAKKDGMPAMAITDHGNMYGAIEFYKTAKKEGVKPIIGVEAYITAGSRHDRTAEAGGTKRYWEFKVARWILRDTPQQVEWEYLDASPFNPAVS